jgi:hypothetical protein
MPAGSLDNHLTTHMDPKIQVAAEAVERSMAERLALRRSSNRDERLAALLEDLDAVRAPLTAQLRHGPKYGRSDFLPEVRRASDAVITERRRVKRMLDGHPYRKRKRPRPRLWWKQVRGTIRWAWGVYHDAADLLAVDPRSLPMSDQFAWREDAREHIAKCRAARLKVGKAVHHYRLSHKHPTKDLWTDTPKEKAALKIRDALKGVEQSLDRRAKIQPSPPRDPTRNYNTSWTRAGAVEALDGWAAVHGRRPRKRELPDHPELPSWGTLYRLGVSLVQPTDLVTSVT